MWYRLGIATALYVGVVLMAVLLAPPLYTSLPYTRAPTPLLNGVMSILGPGVGSLDVHGGVLWIALGVLVTLPWFLGYAATKKPWLSGVGAILWIVSGVLLAYFLA